MSEGRASAPLDLEIIERKIAVDDADSFHNDTWTLLTKGEGRALVAEVKRLRAVLDPPAADVKSLSRLDRPLDTRTMLLDIPKGLYVGANRYDTDDEMVLHMWTKNGESIDVRSRK